MNDVERWLFFDGPESEPIRPLLEASPELPSATPEEQSIRIIEDGTRSAPENFTTGAMEGVVKVDAPWLGIQIEGDVDDRIKGGPQAVLDGLKAQLADPSRGVSTELLQEGASSRPGWQMFKIIIQFE